MAVIAFAIPGHLPSRANERLSRKERNKLTRYQRQSGYLHTYSALNVKRVKLPVAVKLTRIAPRPLDDDNLPAAFKNLRDGIADAFGVGDSKRDPITWEYEEVIGPDDGVKVEIRETPQ